MLLIKAKIIKNSVLIKALGLQYSGLMAERELKSKKKKLKPRVKKRMVPSYLDDSQTPNERLFI